MTVLLAIGGCSRSRRSAEGASLDLGQPGPEQSRTSAPGESLAAVVTSVTDGDTLVAQIGSTNEHVRLLGIDTPETKRPGQPVECFGPQAAAALSSLLPPGTTIRVERDKELRDHFGRALLYVWRSDGVFVNEALLSLGVADVLVIEPNHAHTTTLLASRDAARAAGIGLWSACVHTTGPP